MEGTLIEFNTNKLHLIHYLDLYKKIREIDDKDRPAEVVVNNIYLCDDWLQRYMAKLKEKNKTMQSQSGGKRTEREQFNF
jgi:hypothetical protein